MNTDKQQCIHEANEFGTFDNVTGVCWVCGKTAKQAGEGNAPREQTFKQVKIGQTFDFISPGFGNSFFDECVKISTRKYRSLVTNLEFRIGSLNAEVYHVGEYDVSLSTAEFAGEGNAPRVMNYAELNKAFTQMDAECDQYRAHAERLAEALKEAESLIRGYRAGWDKEVTAKVLAPMREALAQWEAGQ
jgi:hypothetical protein